ncbi:capsular polysaccharide biosynthesis protein, putative chain length regulator [Listeria fleischmannii 1991]|nr:capsular polysaccharide biosynthesis protein, putative chain length regulator [Listeria fleischmannii 1991]
MALFVITPSYQMQSQVLVVPSSEDQSGVSQSAEVQANLQMINTYKALIKSPKVLSQVSKDLDGKYSVNQLSEMIQPSTEENSQVINITATTDSPEEAARITNATAKEFVKTTPKIMRNNNIQLLNEAYVKSNEKPIFPKPTLFAAVGLLGGLFVGVSLLILKTLFSNKITREEDFEVLDMPILGLVGKISKYN